MTGKPIARRAFGRIIVLNGTSSSGKTTLAKHLQLLSSSEAFLHVSLDSFREMEPPGYWSAGAKDLWPLRVESLCRSMNAAAAAYARAGESVIVDHVLPDEGWSWMAQDFAGLRVFFIGVHCDPAELLRREQARGDRPAGLAASQHGLHRGRVYDFQVDTTSVGAQECAKALHRWLTGAADSELG
jgi:chloramphenicol 3-O phosphotransferase